MTTFSKGLQNSRTDIEGFMKDLGQLYTSGVSMGANAASLQVVQRGAGADRSVDVSIGNAFLLRPTGDYGFWVWQDAATNLPITTAPATNSRIDAIVAWLDISVTNVTLNNSPGSLKFAAIVGTVAGSPVAPTDAAIQTALGSTVAWTRLGNVTVGTNALALTAANITDARIPITSRTTAQIGPGSVTTAAIAASAINSSKVDWSTAGQIWWQELGRITATGSVASITTPTLPVRKYLRVMFTCIPAAAISMGLQFNGDAAGNYPYRVSTNGGADATGATSQVPIDTGGSSTETVTGDYIITNTASRQKLITGTSTSDGTGGANVPNRRIGVAKWTNASSSITTITLLANISTMAAGSELIVLGHD